jgi:hypothetical protein
VLTMVPRVKPPEAMECRAAPRLLQRNYTKEGRRSTPASIFGFPFVFRSSALRGCFCRAFSCHAKKCYLRRHRSSTFTPTACVLSLCSVFFCGGEKIIGVVKFKTPFKEPLVFCV